MKSLPIILLACLLLTTNLLFSQSNSLYKEGLSFFENKQYNDALNSFTKAYNRSNEKQKQYPDLCYWYALTCYKLDKKTHKNKIEKLLVEANRLESVIAAEFYCMNYSVLNQELDGIIRYNVYKRKDYAKTCFYKANMCAKSSNKTFNAVTFSLLEEALQNGYKIPKDYLENEISKFNEKRYLETLQKYNVEIISISIKQYVEEEINKWQKKGKFEKTAHYKNRVTELARQLKIKELTQQYIDSAGAAEFKLSAAKNDYDADNEVFELKFKNDKILYLPVPISEAPAFDKNFKNLIYENPTFTISNNSYELLHIEIRNPQNHKIYIYDSNEKIAFNSNKLELSIDEIKIDIEEQSVGNRFHESKALVKVGKSDVDINIPELRKQNPNKFALIIGNENYQSYQTGLKAEQNVEFAMQDALIFKEYCIKSLGIPSENIIFKTNAGVVQMLQSIKKINTIIKTLNGEAEIVFYYAGHGYPSEKNNEPYLIPVDVNSSSLDMAVNISDIIEKFSEYPSKRIVMLLDACFSGGGRNMGLLASRGIKVIPNKPMLQGNIVMLSASSAEQSALPYNEKGHGLFTYFLLKKLQESKGEASLFELDKYLNNQVSIKATMLHAREQNPKTSFSEDVSIDWKNWKL